MKFGYLRIAYLNFLKALELMHFQAITDGIMKLNHMLMQDDLAAPSCHSLLSNTMSDFSYAAVVRKIILLQ